MEVVELYCNPTFGSALQMAKEEVKNTSEISQITKNSQPPLQESSNQTRDQEEAERRRPTTECVTHDSNSTSKFLSCLNSLLAVILGAPLGLQHIYILINGVHIT